MGKIKKQLKSKTLKTSFARYIIVCILGALLISSLLSNLCQFGQSLLYEKYQDEYRNYAYELRLNSNVGDSVLIYTESITNIFTPVERVIYNTLGFFSIGVYPLCFMLSIMITSILFYKRELQTPLAILNDATDHIAENDLDFKISYDKEDELGKLCSSFEKMRLALQDNTLEMLRQMEERKRLNVAFAHDLRTPLTVLKGQCEMLVKYTPKMTEEKIVSTAEMMERHIARLEAYVTTMNDLQRLEDIEILREQVTIDKLVNQMNVTGASVCGKKELIFKNEISSVSPMELDVSVIMQVYENLLANAVRYANNKVMITISLQKDYFILTVIDDGNGFTAKDLSSATKPFYKAEKETNHEHFGMGLNICKILCEKHGGYLNLSNEHGAKVVVAFKSNR